MNRLDSTGPVRKLKNSRRALTGKVNLEPGGVAGFESSLERDLFLVLDSGLRRPNRWATFDGLSSEGSSVQSAGIGATSHRTEAEVVPKWGLTNPSMWRMNQLRSSAG